MTELKKIETKLQSKIDNVLDNFDFEKVHKVMTFLDWRWAFSDNGVPEIYELRASARKLLEEVVDCYVHSKMNGDNVETFYTATGGFRAQISYDILSLSFELESWDEENILDKPEED